VQDPQPAYRRRFRRRFLSALARLQVLLVEPRPLDRPQLATVNGFGKRGDRGRVSFPFELGDAHVL